MKLRPTVLLAGILLVSSNYGWAKPEGAVDGVNRLARSTERVGGEAFSPAAAFFTLLMLGELGDGETGDRIHTITGLREWRGDAARAGGTVGWLALDNTWWLDRIDSPSDAGRRVVDRFRGRILPVDFWRAEDLREAGVDRWVSPGVARTLKGVLLTEADFRPRWKYAMRAAGTGDFKCGNGRSMRREYIQSRIIPAKVWTHGDGVEFAVELDGGGEAFFSTGEGRGTGGAELAEAIVFMPKFSAESIVDCGAMEELGRAAGGGSAYGNLLSYGDAELSKWVQHSKVDFREGGTNDWPGTTGAGKVARPPVVLRLDAPFFYRITGAHGEVVMQGHVGCGAGLEDSR